jgi:hypothetical protein
MFSLGDDDEKEQEGEVKKKESLLFLCIYCMHGSKSNRKRGR